MAKGNSSKLGKWNKTEHDRFMKALQKYGKNWAMIQQSVGTRTLTQVRSHAQKLFLSMTKSEIKALETELEGRFESFCNAEAKKELQQGKKTTSKGEATEAFIYKQLDSTNNLSEPKSSQKEIEQKIQGVRPGKEGKQTQGMEELLNQVSNNGLMAQRENIILTPPLEQMVNLNLNIFQMNELGVFPFVQPAFIWLPY